MDYNLSLPNQSTQQSQIPSYPFTPPSNNDISGVIQRYKLLLAKRWWILIFTGCIGGIIAALNVLTKPISYTSICKLEQTLSVTSTKQTELIINEIREYYSSIEETITSKNLQEKAIRRIQNLYPDLSTNIPPPLIRKEHILNSAITTIIATGEHAKYTKIFLQALIDEYLEYRNSSREQTVKTAIQTLSANLVKDQNDLRKRRDDWEAFRKINNMTSIKSLNESAAQSLTTFRNQLESLELRYNEAKLNLTDIAAAIINKQNAGSINQQPNATPRTGNSESSSQADSSSKNNPGMDAKGNSYNLSISQYNYITQKQAYHALLAERDEKLTRLRDAHPTIIEINEDISKAKYNMDYSENQVRQEFDTEINDLKRKIVVHREKIEIKQREVNEYGEKIAIDERLENEVGKLQTTIETQINEIGNVLRRESFNSNPIVILDQVSDATITKPDSFFPIILGFFMGMLVGVIMLLIINKMDDRINSIMEFDNTFPGAQVLAQIPDQRNQRDVPIIKLNDERHLYIEAFRNLRSSIIFKDWHGKSPTTIMITSSVPNEGKTTISTNLAIILAQSGSRVLLMDCDLRRGGVHELLGRPLQQGVSEILSKNIEWRSTLQTQVQPNLDFISRGDLYDNVTELLLSKQASELMQEVSREYDYVIVDSAPILVADDSSSFAPQFDAVLFVARLSSTSAKLIQKSIRSLSSRQVLLAGFILNRASVSLREYSYYNYASYYYRRPPTPIQNQTSAKI
jgi:capsular exopolysaccharide synthesis family protein